MAEILNTETGVTLKQKLDAFVHSSVELLQAWVDYESEHGGRVLVESYPAGLPHFEEFVDSLIAWRHANTSSRE